jgi:uncharacterized protein YigE (DUF2233 family)
MTSAARLSRIAGLLALLALIGCGTIAIGGTPQAAQAVAAGRPCARRGFEGAGFIVCTFDPRTEALRVLDIGANGTPLRSFAALGAFLGPDATHVLFAMNAGMFDENGTPIGLEVEAGSQRHPINTANGPGNFHMKPNGVFWIDRAGTPHVDTTRDFIALARSPQWATQSGPMLVIAGTLNPKIARNGPSKFVRNGVGIAPGGDALFVISDTVISFGKLARFFRDRLQCQDALYFDGNVSSLWAPSLGRKDSEALLGPMVVVISR